MTTSGRVAGCLLGVMAAVLAPGSVRRSHGEDFKTPSISVVQPDWQAAVDQLKTETADTGRLVFAVQTRSRKQGRRAAPALWQLNAITAEFFAGINRSTVPVLLPFDTAKALSEHSAPGTSDISADRYQSGFQAASMFDAGPSGYDAVFTLRPGDGGLPPRVYAKPVQIQITGSLLLYDINDPHGGKGTPVKSLASQFPDLRRIIREGFVRYAFTRFDVPYVVFIQCLDSAPRKKRLACREASAVAEHFLKSLRVVGGMPASPRRNIQSAKVERPAAASPDFTYRRAGEIIANTGYNGQPGHRDDTVYAQIRFPLADAPAYANSQSFLNWGDCYHTGRIGWRPVKGDEYRCKRNDKPLVFDESAKENYSYPWQDNFCETRDFEVGQCANGYGHQGQDIRPPSCLMKNDGADRCLPGKFAAVAVRDGVIVRAAKQQAVHLVVNNRNEHIRFRYMHMNPVRLDEERVLHGRRLTEGEPIGMIANFQDYPGGTTAHLHFDVQVFTREGWLWVNPYVTLISAYERLIGGHGREYAPPSPDAPAMAHAEPDSETKASSSQ
ncbi:M23 family peptidase [Afipia sp. TerB]